LEHLVQDLQEMSPTFHDRLVALYFDEAADRRLDKDHQNKVREKLVKFLEDSDQYMPERVLARLQSSNPLPETIPKAQLKTSSLKKQLC
jgi:hypothetical protein